MLVRHGWVTNSSSSNFLVWYKCDQVTPDMVKSWHVVPRMRKHTDEIEMDWDDKLKRRVKRREANLLPSYIAERLNAFLYELTPEWLVVAIQGEERYLRESQEKALNAAIEYAELPEDRVQDLVDLDTLWADSTRGRIEELRQMKELQDAGFKTYLYRCSDLSGLDRKCRKGPLRDDSSDVGVALHLIQHSDMYSDRDPYTRQARFQETSVSGIRGLVYYVWPEECNKSCGL